MDKRKLEAIVTKFLEKLPILCLKGIENFEGVAWLIWMPHPFLKNRSDTYETPCMHAYIHGYVVDSDQVRVYYTVCSNPNQVKAKSKQWFKRSDGSAYKWLKLIMSPQKNGYIALYIQNINMIIATMFPILMLEWRSNPIRCVLGAL